MSREVFTTQRSRWTVEHDEENGGGRFLRLPLEDGGHPHREYTEDWETFETVHVTVDPDGWTGVLFMGVGPELKSTLAWIPPAGS